MNPKMSALRKKAMALPLLPGVYIMHGKDGTIIYIGSQYFGSQNNHPEKVRRMVDNVDDFEYIITDSEFEALILECSLIKQHTPKYNILLKDDKGYSYIRVGQGDWGKISYVLQKADDGARYIGPYKSSFYVKTAVEEANKIFMLPTCGRKFPQDFGKGRPCLNYHIRQCMAPCTGRVKKSDYAEALSQALDFLKGGSSNSVKLLTEQMEQAAENLEFERAARLRDRIAAVKKMGEKQKQSFVLIIKFIIFNLLNKCKMRILLHQRFHPFDSHFVGHFVVFADAENVVQNTEKLLTTDVCVFVPFKLLVAGEGLNHIPRHTICSAATVAHHITAYKFFYIVNIL